MIQLSPAEIDRYEERASVMEFDGKMTRQKAEFHARMEILKARIRTDTKQTGGDTK